MHIALQFALSYRAETYLITLPEQGSVWEGRGLKKGNLNQGAIFDKKETNNNN